MFEVQEENKRKTESKRRNVLIIKLTTKCFEENLIQLKVHFEKEAKNIKNK